MRWRTLGRFHVQVGRDLNKKRSDDSVKSVIDLTSLNTAFKVDAGREKDAAELIKPFIDVNMLLRITLPYHHT